MQQGDWESQLIKWQFNEEYRQRKHEQEYKLLQAFSQYFADMRQPSGEVYLYEGLDITPEIMDCHDKYYATRTKLGDQRVILLDENHNTPDRYTLQDLSDLYPVIPVKFIKDSIKAEHAQREQIALRRYGIWPI